MVLRFIGHLNGTSNVVASFIQATLTGECFVLMVVTCCSSIYNSTSNALKQSKYVT